jgi:DNA-binding transcriptional ArsR family regulator
VEALAAIADPTRSRIVELLAEREHSVTELREHFSLSQPAISQHLKVLRDANVAVARVEGTRRLYTLQSGGLDEVSAWVEGVRSTWARHLGALDAYLDTNP